MEPERGDASTDYNEYLEQVSRMSDSGVARASTGDFEDRPSLEATITKAETLTEHMIQQIRMAEFSVEESAIAFHVIGNLNRDGYLSSSVDEIVEATKQPAPDVEAVLKAIQYLDPVGVAARNLQECLLIQLDSLGLGETLETKIIRDHLDKLERQKFDLIAKAEQVPVERVYAAVSKIRSLEPRPGRPFADDDTRYVVPDIYVYKVGEEYVINLNEDGLPRLRVNPFYIDLLKKQESETNPNKGYLSDRLKAASWLIKSIHQRQSTIYKVTQSIVKFQHGFLDHGISALKPLVLKDVADDIGMHESTVSRVTTSKYVHTPQGVFELKFFFSNAIKTALGDVSSSTIKDRIKSMIAAEAPDHPISDQEIVEVLQKENIDIARRTVAKYRESLGILSSSKRKKVF
jgi:RNA polymerase sigma-54 factor